MAQSIYFSHGGGPMPLLHDPSHEIMNQFMKSLPEQLERPQAIVVFSAHWEHKDILVQHVEAPGMVYDYYGFPKETYEITYPCKGNLELAKEIHKAFVDNGLSSELEFTRGIDHGVYIPLMLMYPEADIPVIQVSLRHSLDPKEHLLMGEALRPLMDRPILFIGSGFSFHNLRAFSMRETIQEDVLNNAFQDWLIAVNTEMDENERNQHLIAWDMAPNAKYCHPREEHLLPLHVCAGTSSNHGKVLFDNYIAGKRSLAILWK